ncbi:MAG TPA: hypothetical protein VMZ53_03335 [Kofleriaceae bacterium]|nr:hypothetical protein [Kofleriaceae bacterium]
MRNGIVLVVAIVAACKGDRGKVGRGSSTAEPSGPKVHVSATPLPVVGTDARLLPANAPVPAHELVIDATGRIAALGVEENWPEVLVQADTQDPLTGESIVTYGANVHRKLMDDYDKKRMADADAAEEAEVKRRIEEGEQESAIRHEMATAHYEPEWGHLGPYLFADKPYSMTPIIGDGVAVREGAPSRMPRLMADTTDTNPPEPFLFVVAANAPAHVLVDAMIATSGGLIAVAAPHGVRALRLSFKHIEPNDAHFWEVPWAPWIEVRLGAGTIDVEAVPGTPVRLTGAVDGETLQDTIAKLRAQRPGLAADHSVDVLVDDRADAQHLVTVLAALDLANANEISLGLAPRPADGDVMRGKPLSVIPVPAIEAERGEGALGTARDLIVPRMPAIRKCFADAPAKTAVVIRTDRNDKTRAITSRIEGKPSPVATCVFAELEDSFNHQTAAFKVRFARIES